MSFEERILCNRINIYIKQRELRVGSGFHEPRSLTVQSVDLPATRERCCTFPPGLQRFHGSLCPTDLWPQTADLCRASEAANEGCPSICCTSTCTHTHTHAHTDTYAHLSRRA